MAATKRTKAKKPRPVAAATKRLTGPQQAFVMHLAADPKHDQSAAALAAGYSPKSAKVIGSQLMCLPQFDHVRRAYQALVDARLAKLNVTEDRIERALAAAAFGDRRKIVKVAGGQLEVTPTDELFDEDLLMVESYKAVSKNDGTDAVTLIPVFCNRLGALTTLAKVKGMLRDRHEVKLDVTLNASAAAEESFLGRLARLATAGSPEGVLPAVDPEGTPRT